MYLHFSQLPKSNSGIDTADETEPIILFFIDKTVVIIVNTIIDKYQTIIPSNMHGFGDTNMIILHFDQMWGFPRSQISLEHNVDYAGIDSQISVSKDTSVWFILKGTTETYYCNSKTDKDELIYLIGDLMYIDLDKIHVTKK